jgi:hypothetical protein
MIYLFQSDDIDRIFPSEVEIFIYFRYNETLYLLGVVIIINYVVFPQSTRSVHFNVRKESQCNV